jgi:hypothetical protein
VVRFEGHGIESRRFKNRDKQMTFIVRVSFSYFYNFVIDIATFNPKERFLLNISLISSL